MHTVITYRDISADDGLIRRISVKPRKKDFSILNPHTCGSAFTDCIQSGAYLQVIGYKFLGFIRIRSV